MSRRARERAGRSAELVAEVWLRIRGFRVLARRFSTPVGEIDLVVRRGALTVFVEVKRRLVRATALEAVQPRQQQRIARAAQLWLRHHPSPACRFDVVAISPWRLPTYVRDVWRPSDDLSLRPARAARRAGPA